MRGWVRIGRALALLLGFASLPLAPGLAPGGAWGQMALVDAGSAATEARPQALAVDVNRPADVLDLRLGDHGDRTRFVLEVSRQLDYHLFAADDGGPRLVLDLPRVGFERFLGDRDGLGLIETLRGGPRRDGGGRMVLEMTGPVTVETVFYIPPRDGFGHRLVIDIVPASAEDFALLARHTLGNPAISLGGVDRTGADIPLASQPVQVPAQAPAPPGTATGLADALPLAPPPFERADDPDLALTLPQDRATPDAAASDVAAATIAPAPAPVPVAPTPPLRPAAAGIGGQPPLPDNSPTAAASGPVAPEPPTAPPTAPPGDGVADRPVQIVTAALGPLPPTPRRPPVDWPVVVIDPGHGGVDPGAVAVSGVFEKAITLAVSRRLADRLRATGRIRVHMTREDDRFLALRERVTLARGWGGDLFMSIHADSIDNAEIRGASVYTLSDVASDAEAAALARRENRVDAIAGVAIDPEDDVMASILIDLAQQSTFRESHRFAGEVIAALDGTVPLLPNTHRQAGFAVLKAPDVPSVLIELGYLSSTSDARLLTDSAHQDRLADRLAAAVIAHFDAVGRLDLPDSQAAALPIE